MLAHYLYGTVKDGDFWIIYFYFNKPSYSSKLRMVYFLLISLINSTTKPINVRIKVPNASISCNVSEIDTFFLPFCGI